MLNSIITVGTIIRTQLLCLHRTTKIGYAEYVDITGRCLKPDGYEPDATFLNQNIYTEADCFAYCEDIKRISDLSLTPQVRSGCEWSSPVGFPVCWIFYLFKIL